MPFVLYGLHEGVQEWMQLKKAGTAAAGQLEVAGKAARGDPMEIAELP